MKIHEYQAKSIFKREGIPVPRGILVESQGQVKKAVEELGVNSLVVKAQIQAGGRGKAGGVRLVKGEEECFRAVSEMLGRKLLTHQSGRVGSEVRKVLVEEAVPIAKEYYLAVTLDRQQGKGVIVYSRAGGMDIEEIAKTQPEKISKKHFDIVLGLSSFEAGEVAFELNSDPPLVKEIGAIVQKMAEMFVRLDATLVEINPLVMTSEGKVVAIDAKMDFDDNGLYRHKDLLVLRDPLEEDSREVEAKQYGLSYVGLDGNVGCMVNGAGLAMATMDVIRLAGGMPANFLDVGGSAKVDQVKAAFKIILQDAKVKAILVNIFGGIMKCDVIAEGIIQAVEEIKMGVPLVVRLEGTHVEKGRVLLQKSGICLKTAESLREAASLVVELAGKS